ncbi:MAG: RNA polymerase sigma factor [Myxococcota bacterium]
MPHIHDLVSHYAHVETNTVKRPGAGGRVVDPLIARCQDGEEAAFNELYVAHAQWVYRVCFAMVGHTTEAEDVTQAVFGTAFRRIHKFDGSSKFTTWLYGIIVRTVANQRQGRRNRRRLLNTYRTDNTHEHTKGPESQVAARQLLTRIDSALAAVPRVKRLPFLLYYIEGLKLDEIAALTRSSVQTTHARIKSTRERIFTLVSKLPAKQPRGSSR